MAANNGAIVLILGIAGIGAWLYTQQKKPVNNPALITAPPPIPAYNPMLPAAPAQQAANGLASALTGGLKSLLGGGGTSWASMPTGVNKQGQAAPLLNNNAFVSRL